MPSTEDLVRSVQQGETSAFADLVRCYERAAVITAHSVLKDFHLAQDVAQEAFVVAHQRLGQLRDAASFGPWLLRIVRRRALRSQRRMNREQLLGESIERAVPYVPDWMEPYEEAVEQIARLPEHERIVVILRYLDGHSVKQIAESTGRPMGTITKQLSRAIERLRDRLIEVWS